MQQQYVNNKPELNANSFTCNLTNFKVIGSILMVDEVRGHLSVINELVEHTGAKAVIHTGNFGFYSPTSYQNLHIGELRYLADHLFYGSRNERLDLANNSSPDTLRDFFSRHPMSQLQEYIEGRQSFKVPVYTVWGNREDFEVLREFYVGTKHVPNLYILFPNASYTIPCGDLMLRVFGLGGAVFHDRLFNLGAGDGSISGDSGHCWVNFLQIGELLEMAQRLPKVESEVRIFVSHCAVGREPLVNLISRELQAVYSVTGGHHSRMTNAYNEFSTHSLVSIKEWLAGPLKSLDEMVQRVLECKEISDREHSLTLLAINSLKRQFELIKEDNDLKRGTCIALVNYFDGYSLLNAYDDNYLGVDTFSRGVRFFFRPKTTFQSQPVPQSQPDPQCQLQAVPQIVDNCDSIPASPSSNSGGSRLSEMASSNYAGSVIVIVSNLPCVRDEDEVRETLLGEYRLRSVSFYNRFRDAVRCEAEDEATAIRIQQELDGTTWQSATLRVSRVGAGAKASAIFNNNNNNK